MDKNFFKTITAKVLITIAVCLGLIIFYIVCDCLNIFSSMGMDVLAINENIMTLVIGNIVAVGLFVITFFLIDQSKIKRRQNQEKSIKIILNSIYSKCFDIVQLFKNDKSEIKAVAKCNFSEKDETPLIINFREAPFSFENYVIEASNSGVLEENELKNYLKIKQNFQEYITLNLIYIEAQEIDTDTEGLEILKKRIDEVEKIFIEDFNHCKDFYK